MASPIYLLDTCVILHLVRGNPLGSYLATTFGLKSPASRPLVSIVSHGELLLIADRNKWGAQKMAALRMALDNLVTIAWPKLCGADWGSL